VRGVIVALDVPDAESAVTMAQLVTDYVVGFQVGAGLLHGPGPLLISTLLSLGKPVLVDAALHGTPTQTEAAARQLGRHGARWVTAHVAGGQAMLEAAVRGLEDGSGDAPAGILGITVLTSLDRAALAKVGIDRSPGKLVARMAKAAAASGCEGVVSAPQELTVIADVAPSLLKVTPGIRLDERSDDQAMTMHPVEALDRGAELLVVGRPITNAADPSAAAEAIAAMVAVSPRVDR